MSSPHHGDVHLSHQGAAALQVGYENAYQFNREFKRLFEITPGQDAARTRRTSMQVVAE